MRNSQCNTGLVLSAKLNALAPPVFSKEKKVVKFTQDTIDGKVEDDPKVTIPKAEENVPMVSIPKAEYDKLLELAKQVPKLAKQVSLDDLTGLFNSRRFEDQLKHDVSVARRHIKKGGDPDNLVLMYFDVNGLKYVNDTYGHETTGNDLMRRAAGVISNYIKRESDTVARLHGDEFAAILPQTDMESAKVTAGKLQEEAKALGVLIAVGLASYKLSVSDPVGDDGVYQRSIDEVTLELKDKADTAMYANKEETKKIMNIAQFYDRVYGKTNSKMPAIKPAPSYAA